ncbi:sugar phosphate isomerase/epimerase family protein [Enterococcus bulliens]
MKISLQLWSIQDTVKEDLLATLKQVKRFGYDGVEFAGYFDHSAADIKMCLDELGLEVSGTHYPIEQLEEHFEEVLLFEETIGNHNLIVPYLDGHTVEEWRNYAKRMARIQEKLVGTPFRLGYHNHAHEFDVTPHAFDILLEKLPTLALEVDTYWVAYAKHPVIAFLNQYQKNIDWLHIKDMQEEPIESTEISSGVLPIKTYLKWAKQHEMEWLIIEQEAFQRYAPLESAQKNYRALEILRIESEGN